MIIRVFEDKESLGRHAASIGADALRKAIRQKDAANVILATGASQFEVLRHLVSETDIDWGKVTCFHLDEYAGMDSNHPASFRRYLRERFVEQLGVPLAAFHFIAAEGDLGAECKRVGDLIKRTTVDVAWIGIGENGHVAFNDPPADFETDEPYLVVELDEACRRQQVGEGWFPSLLEAPSSAISMSIRQILKSRKIICSAPDLRKAAAVQGSLEGPIHPACPASILRTHGDIELLLDVKSSSLLARETLVRYSG